MLAVGYSRISDKDQSHNSIENQCDGIKEYCSRNKLTLQEIFIDKGRSAFTFNRPAWQSLEQAIKANKKIKFVIVYHLDRFSRANLMDALIKINELENKLNVKVLTVRDPVNLDTDDLGVQMLRTIGLLFSSNERQRIKERTVDGIYRSLNLGRYCSMAPFGYINSTDSAGNPLLKIDPGKSSIIKNIFKLYNEGMNIERVGSWAREKGFKRRSKSAISRVLTNCIYAGLIHVPAYKGQPEKFIAGIHPPIIEEHEFWLAYRKVRSKTHAVQVSAEVPLRGVLHCHCGRKLTAGNSRSKSGKYYWYYVCPEHKINLSAVKLHAQLKEILNSISFSEKDIDWFRKTITESIDKAISSKGGDIMRSKLELEKVEKKIRGTQERFLLAPDISMEVYSNVITELKENESRLQNNITAIQRRSKEMYDLLESLLPLLGEIGELFFKFGLHQQQRFIVTAFSDVLYYQNAVYRTPYIFPLFADKILILKEKGMVLTENPSFNIEHSTICASAGSFIEHLRQLQEILIA